MRNFVNSSTDHPDAEIAQIALEAMKNFDKYGDLLRTTQVDETGRLLNLIEDLRGMGTQKLTKAGLTPFFNNLEQKNNEFIEAVKTRIEEKGDRFAPGVIKKKREEADGAYRRLVETVNALAVVNGEAPYLSFMKPVNALIDEMRTTLANRRTSTKKRTDKKKPGDDKKPKDPKKPDEKPKDPKKPKPDEGDDDIHLPEE